MPSAAANASVDMARPSRRMERGFMSGQRGRARRNGRQHARPKWRCRTVGLANQNRCLRHGKSAEYVDADASSKRSRLLPKGGDGVNNSPPSPRRLADRRRVKQLGEPCTRALATSLKRAVTCRRSIIQPITHVTMRLPGIDGYSEVIHRSYGTTPCRCVVFVCLAVSPW